MPKRRHRKRNLLIAILLALLALIAVTVYSMARGDAEFRRFYETGRSINSFLSDYCRTLKATTEDRQLEALLTFYAEDYLSPSRGSWQLSEGDREAGIEIRDLEAIGEQDFRLADREQELAGYFEGIQSINSSSCKIGLIEELGKEGDVVLTVRQRIDAQDREGRLFQDKSLSRWRLRSPAEGNKWRIVSDRPLRGVRVLGDGESFEPLDRVAAGIDFEHQRDPKLDPHRYTAELQFELIQHAGTGVSAVDYDDDGRTDLFFADGVRSRLYRNDSPAADGSLSFSDVTSEVGLDGLDQANAGLFGDVDNDGFKDLVVVRYLAPTRFYRNRGDGTFEDRSTEVGLDFSAPAMAVTFLDFDRDGFLDLYVGVYGDAFREIPRLPFFARNGGRNRLFRNQEGERFQDVTDLSGTGNTGWTLAVGAGDFDADGWPDLVVANDFGRKCLYRNRGDGTFSEVAREAGILDFGAGMAVAFGDVDNDGLLDLYTSNVQSNQRWFGEDLTLMQYRRNVLRTKWAILDFGEYWRLYELLGSGWWSLGRQIGEGNSLFMNRGDGSFEELRSSAVELAGWSWGVALADFDNDTDLDIYAANGWITSQPGSDL